MEVTGQLHSPAVLSQEETNPLLVEYEALGLSQPPNTQTSCGPKTVFSQTNVIKQQQNTPAFYQIPIPFVSARTYDLKFLYITQKNTCFTQQRRFEHAQ